MTHFIRNPVQQPYLFKPPAQKLFYLQSEQPVIKPPVFNATPQLSSPKASYSVAKIQEPLPFSSPKKKFIERTSEKKENVDDIVAKCLSRTQKLIEGIKKVKKCDDNQKNNSISSQMAINLPLRTSPFKRTTVNDSQSSSRIFLNTPQILSRNSFSPSRIIINHSPSRILLNTNRIIQTPSPRRLLLNSSPLKLSSIFRFINPIYAANEIDSYKGDILENKPHGKGICFYKNGYKYEGGFQMGVKEGFGILSNSKEEEIYCGDWKLGKFHGDGILINMGFDANKETKDIDYRDISDLSDFWVKYEGEFSEGKINELGTVYLRNGDKIRGKFVNGIINGEGSYYFQDGSVVMGYWEKGRFMMVF